MSFEDYPINKLNAAGAPDFVTFEAKALLDMAVAHFEAATGRTLSPSQVEMYLLETIAYLLTVRGAEEQVALGNSFIAYAQPEWLDRHGADRNTPRLQAVPATTTLRFSTQAPAVSRIRIPAGTRVSDSAGQVQFLTLAVAFIEVGGSEIDVSSEATVTGVSANGFPAGSLVAIIDPVPGLTAVTNLTETGGGGEIESDTRYRARLSLAFETIGNGLSKERYASDVLAWNVRCIDVGIDRPQPGYVSITPLMDTGAPNAEELATLLAVFDQSNTHQGDFIQVGAPVSSDFGFDLHLTLSDPDAADPAQIAVQAVLDGWATRLGGYIAPSELISAAKATIGVIDADIPDLALVQVASDAWRNGSITSVTVQVLS